MGKRIYRYSMSPSRRDFIKTSTAASAAAQVAAAAPERQRDLIRKENAREGTKDWQLTRVRPVGFRNPAIEDYCSHQSIRAGEELRVMVGTEPVEKFSLEIFRMGYYGGRGARHITENLFNKTLP